MDPDFSKGLLPCVAQNAATGAVLMLAFLDREAWEATRRTGEMHFHSRSRGGLWRKGATSGNTLRVVSLHLDCDADAVLALVEPAGPACHTGAPTCFHAGGDAPELPLAHLERVFRERAERPVEGSHTSRLMADENLRLKKVAEEAAELVMAAKDRDADAAAREAADLVYHALAAASAAGAPPSAVLAELARRRR